MDAKEIGFVAAAVLVVAWRWFAGSQLGQRNELPNSETIGRASIRRLVLASFLTLFAELAFIRWIAVEVRVFAYFKNLALLLCFVGFGLGCSLAGKPTRWRTAITALVGLLLVIRFPFGNQP